MTLFQVKQLVKNFGGLNAIDHLDLHVNKGEVVSIIGPNGAGKTSVFNVITGFYPPTAGDITFENRPITGLTPDEITGRGITRTFQNVRLFTNMTIIENVLVGMHRRRDYRTDIVNTVLRTPHYQKIERRMRDEAIDILGFFGKRLVGYRLNQPAYVLSYANRRRLEIARAMATGARMLLLDEPAAGMNPRETREISELIGRLREERGYTVLVIEHDMRLVREVSDRVIAMDYGRKIAEGTYDAVANDPSVIEAYLGRTTTTEK